MSIKALQRKIWSISREPTKFETKILECLARFGPLNINQIRVKLSCAYSSTRKAIFNLVGKGFVIESGIMTVKRTGLETQTYDLTLKGVLLILKKELAPGDTERWNYNLIHKIIRKYSSLLPLVFGKWSYFDKMKVGKIARFRLKVLVDTYAADPLSFRKGTGVVPWMEMEQQICWFFYFQFNHLKFGKPWMTALKQDKEIRTYVIKELKAYQKRLENLNTIIDDNLVFLEKH